MDIQVFLKEWSSVEPNRCEHVGDDQWRFYFDDRKAQEESTIQCDVITVHGVGVIEDLISECIRKREGWTYELLFDRSEELFSARVIDASGSASSGLESLNPGIALLSAYLDALKNAPPA